MERQIVALGKLADAEVVVAENGGFQFLRAEDAAQIVALGLKRLHHGHITLSLTKPAH